MKALGSGVSVKLADQLPHAPSCNLNEDEPAVLLSQVDKRSRREADNLQDKPSPRFPDDRLRRTSCHCRDLVRAKNSPDLFGAASLGHLSFQATARGRWESQQGEEEPGAAGTRGHAGEDCEKRVISSVNRRSRGLELCAENEGAFPEQQGHGC